MGYCKKCDGIGTICAHPMRMIFGDKCPEGLNMNCEDCNIVKKCEICDGTGEI